MFLIVDADVGVLCSGLRQHPNKGISLFLMKIRKKAKKKEMMYRMSGTTSRVHFRVHLKKEISNKIRIIL